MSMLVKDDKLHIAGIAVDEKGDRVKDAEALPAKRELTMDAPAAAMGSGVLGPSGRPLGKIPVHVSWQGNVAKFAGELKTQCENCIFFDSEAWLKLYPKLHFSVEGRAKLAGLKDLLLTQAEVDELDEKTVGRMLIRFGVCRVYTEIDRELSLVMPEWPCPSEDSRGNPVEVQYKPKSMAHLRQASKKFDQVMFEAESGLK